MSSYLKRCSESDFYERKAFLLSINSLFPHMPRINFVGHRIMEMNFIEGEDDFALINFEIFGEIVNQLHCLNIDGPLKDTNIQWLLDLATQNLTKINLNNEIDLSRRFNNLSNDAVVHGEITQVITDKNGRLMIIDWDECGIGSRYQDLGFVYYTIMEKRLPYHYYDAFIDSYADDSVDQSIVRSVAGLISLAYASFYDFDRRMKMGKNLLA